MELVVVLTILLALVAIIFPAIYRGSVQAKSVLCSNNLTQIGSWANMYMHTSGDYLPPYEEGWVAKLSQYSQLKVDPGAAPADELQCPSQPFVGLGGLSAANTWRGTNYGINQHIASIFTDAQGDATPYWGMLCFRLINDPASKFMLGDSSGSNFFGLTDKDPTIAGISRFGRSPADAFPPNPAQPFPMLRHIGGTANILMLDGHVEARSTWPSVMLGPGTYGYRTWHAEHQYPGNGIDSSSSAK